MHDIREGLEFGYSARNKIKNKIPALHREDN